MSYVCQYSIQISVRLYYGWYFLPPFLTPCQLTPTETVLNSDFFNFCLDDMGMSPNERPPKDDGSNVIRHPGVCQPRPFEILLDPVDPDGLQCVTLESHSQIVRYHVHSPVMWQLIWHHPGIQNQSCFRCQVHKLEVMLRFFFTILGFLFEWTPTSQRVPGLKKIILQRFPCIQKAALRRAIHKALVKPEWKMQMENDGKPWIFSWLRKGWSIVVDLLSKMSLAANAAKKKQRRICPSNFQRTSVLHIFSVLHVDSFMREYLEVLSKLRKTWKQANCFRTSTLRYFNETPCVTDG